MELNKQTFDRQQLYELVWSNPMVSLAKKYAISDNGLRKICKQMNIPLPKNGHWVKLQFGKKVPITALPASCEGKSETVLLLRTENDMKNTAGQTPLAMLTKQINNDRCLSLIVPDKLSSPDKLIIAARERLSGKNKIHPHNFKGVCSCASDELDIRVAPQNVGRALRFMDTLIKGLRARGHDILLKNGWTYATIFKQEFGISFREKMKKVIVTGTWERTELHPTGVLSFKMDGYYGKEWIGGKKSLESYLPEIVARLELESNRLTERQQYHQRMRDQQQQVERLQIQLQERRKKELADFTGLLQEAARWQKAVNLRRYLDAVEQNLISSDDNCEEKKCWLDWSRKKADWYDPFIEIEDELLAGIDRTTLLSTK